MGSESDGEMEEFSGMELPPLINSLKRILSEYPDGGQIIKELIQNAEDAGATEVKLLYDDRDINQPTGPTDKAYRKFFRGPALCVYNNAVFGDRDWKGIRMIEMSVKEMDPLTVGRFGLGFKSVFHLTDYPCILSGTKLLLIDPQEPNSSKVNAMMDLSKLLGYKKRMDVDAFFTALEGTFGVSRDITTTGKYPGTLFRFPLRQTASRLSSTLYNELKVMDLFNAIESEQTSLLIFLKSLTFISLSRHTVSEGRIELTAIEIKNAAEVQKERKLFQEKSVEISNNPTRSPAQSTLEITVQCTNFSKPSSQKQSICTWLVVNYFMGGNASREFMALIQDTDLASSPYVSVGAPLSSDGEAKPLEGHVFCFLPLPREGTPLTGLPVHVNGFFALNQSRHHVKWLTEEQKRRQVTDKDVLWNKRLIAEALPLAYAIWIEKAVQIAAQNSNDRTCVVSAHHAIPVREKVRDKWEQLLRPLFQKITDKTFLFSQNQKKWVANSAALFTSPAQRLTPEYCQTVIKTLTQMKKHHVDISDGQIETLKHYIGHTVQQTMTPQLFSQFLKQDNSYQSLTSDEKMAILMYLLSDDHTENLQGLQLAPVASGRWESFKLGASQKIYRCSEKLARLFPGLEDRFLLPESSWPINLRSHFDTMCRQGVFQLRTLRDDDETEITMLLQTTIEAHIPGTARKSLSKTNKLNIQWLQEVFQHLVSHRMVSICKKVALIPILKNRIWDNADVDLVKVSEKIILAEEGTAKIPEEVCQCLQALDVEIVPSLPTWVPANALPYRPDKGSFIQLLTNIDISASQSQRRAIIGKFNNTAISCRGEFLLYLGSALPAQAGCIKLLKELKMFPGRDSPTGATILYSMKDGKHFITVKKFPISYPEVLLDGFDEEKALLHKLGAQEIPFPRLIYLTLKGIQASKYNSNDARTLMDFFVQKYDEMRAMCDARLLEQINSLSRQIPFIQCGMQYKRPSDLFNPSDDLLTNLFIEEAKFPEPTCQDKTLKILSTLGLKNREHLSNQDIVSTARLIHQMSQSGNPQDSIRKKAQALMQIIRAKPKYLSEFCDNRPLRTILLDLECVEVEAGRPPDFPKWLPWNAHKGVVCKPSEAKDISVASLVGSVMPVVKPDSQAVVEAFGWKANISEAMLVSQLQKVRGCYHVKHDPELLSYLRILYEWLGTHGMTPDMWREEHVIWVKGFFYVPNEVIIDRTPNDTKLAPYFHYLPDTFKDLKQLFLQLGCRENQRIDVLLTALQQIVRQQTVDQSELTHAVSIIKKLAERRDELSPSEREGILLPVNSENKAVFKPIEECTFTEDPEDIEDEEDEEEQDSPVTYHFVSKDITKEIAELLGVKTLQRRHLMDTEVMAIGQEEDLTTRLSRLIEDGYRDGLSVPKELLQNADDAGARHIKFLYDERENQDAQESLLDNGMKPCQGPALWVYNDARFTDEDFENITKLNAGTKENNAQTIGKFGLGFCSVYNLTDVPSFITGRNLVIFDPNKSHLGENKPGLKIDLSRAGNKRLLRRHRDQFKPYVDVFGCDPFGKDQNYTGTLFRLPLRTEEEAKTSKIKKDPYTRKDMSELLRMFISNAGDLLLFTQNIESIELYHLSSSAHSVTEKTLVVSVTRECSQWKQDSFRMTSDSILSKLATRSKEISEIQKVTIKLEVCEAVERIKPSVEQSQTVKSSTWLISWATGRGESQKLAHRLKNAIPLAAAAVPIEEKSGFPMELSQIGDGFFRDGRMYCFLPLPGSTGLPWHLHGCFEVSSDRRQLTVDTEQDKTSLRSCWNEQLKSDAAVLAFINLLTVFTQQSHSDSYKFHMLWPLNSHESVQALRNSFFKYIVEEDVKIFASHKGFHSFEDIVFLSSDVRNNESIGNVAFDMLLVFPSRPDCTLVDLPTNVMEALKPSYNKAANDKMQNKTIDTSEMLKVFLENIDNSYWDSHVDDRNKMVLFALTSGNKDIEKMIQETRCIPCEASKTLRRPCELVHPSSRASSMFNAADAMFPSNEQHFRHYSVLQKLVKLGMMEHFIPIEILLGRCGTVEGLADECASCAIQRINSIMTYLDNHTAIKKYEENEIKQLSKIFWLPVMTTPSNWSFSWYSESNVEFKKFQGSSCKEHKVIVLMLGTPTQLQRQTDQDYLGSVAGLVDEKTITKINTLSFWDLLGIHSREMHFTKVVDQLSVLAGEYNRNPQNLYGQFHDKYNKIVRHINRELSGQEKQEQLMYCVQHLCDKAVVLINHEVLVCPSVVAMKVQEDCYPYLSRLPSTETLFGKFYSTIGVKDHFSVADVVGAIESQRGSKTELSRQEVKCNIKLLHNLVEAMDFEGNTYDFYKDCHDSITGPDLNGKLRPTFELVMEDEKFVTNVRMKLMHADFPISLGKKLGMKTKKHQCVKQISCGIPWGQKERLVTRLKGLLRDYPSDEGIMKELLQNADDANAKELHFIKDYRTHPVDKFFGAHHLQGPSLCVYNDSHFTEADLMGIQNLGIGSKQTDPSKTGQYGVGFNAVYHLTDTPSFLTKGPGLGDSGILCMLDPLCTNIQVDESDPGLRFSVDEIKENFPDTLSGYLENDGFFQSGHGTMFRFPLRMKESDLSSEIVSKERLDSLLDGFMDEMLNVLLFVKNVNTIKVSSISSSKLVPEYTVRVSMTKEDKAKREQFFKQVKSIVQRNKDDLSKNVESGNIEVSYTLQSEDCRGNIQKWLIVQQFGCHEGYKIDKKIIEAFKKDQFGHMPLGGIAVPYPDFESTSHASSVPVQQSTRSPPGHKSGHSQTKYKNSGQFFTFLPLPVNNGFMVHINGHFSLDSSRRDLWNDGYRSLWNDMLGATVIASSWISAIEYFQKYFDSHRLQEMDVRTWRVMNTMMDHYHSLFPLFDHSDKFHTFSNDLVRHVYSQVFDGESELFPVVRLDQHSFTVSWVALQSGCKLFGAVFNNIYSTLRKEDKNSTPGDLNKQSFILEEVLKDIGISLINSPRSILKTIEHLQCPTVPTASPSFIMEFLKSFKVEKSGACMIGNINSDIKSTHFKSVDRLHCLVTYISHAKEFLSEAEGLPALLTSDNILHQFCIDGSKIYHSEYSSLLPASNAAFVHEQLLQLFNHKELVNNQLLSTLDIRDFNELLQNEELSQFNSGKIVSWNKQQSHTLITPEWIDKFFCFVSHHAALGTEDEMKTFTECIKTFENWSFLPAIYATRRYDLFPISMAFCMIDFRRGSEPILDVLRSVGIPTLDVRVFNTYDVLKLTKNIIANTDKPDQLLNCLRYHKNILVNAEITEETAEIILKYFDNHVDKLKSESCIHSMRCLPLYLTHLRTLVSIDMGDILVLPTDIPSDGLHEWALRTNKTLLRRSYQLTNLFEILGLKCLSNIEFYAFTLVDKLNFLPEEHWLKHIQFMKMMISAPYVAEPKTRKALLMKLKTIQFITVGNGKKRANELYWPNTVFTMMLSETDFPPKDLRTDEWEDFFRELDMTFDVTDELMLRFAKDIEIRGRESISKDTRQKSKVLLECFMESSESWSKNTYHRIRVINFICPHRMADEYIDVHPQPDSASRLICFEGSVLYQNAKLCWTSMNLLPDIEYDSQTIQRLQIHTMPPDEKVILHCQNTCDSLVVKLPQETVSTHFVKSIMREIYTFIENRVDQNRNISRRLDTFQVIHLPLHNTFVTAKAVVTELDINREIKPYLYRAPIHYGEFFNTFIKIGAKEKLELNHCLFVMQQLKNNVGDRPLFPTELEIAKSALLNLIVILQTDLCLDAADGVLYLPNRESHLKDSRDLTVSDNDFFEHQLNSNVHIDYFVGLEELEIKHTNQVAVFKTLPTGLRPAILSNCVQCRVNLEAVHEAESNIRTAKLEDFLHSDEFIHGILRLVKHNMLRRVQEFDEKQHVSQITSNIRNTKVVCVSHLMIDLAYKKQIVPGAEYPCDVHIANESVGDHKRCTFYISQNHIDNNCSDLEWLLSMSIWLIDLVQICTVDYLRFDPKLQMIFTRFERPSEISSELDKLRVESLFMPGPSQRSVFPKPGTYVKEHFHPFLEQSIQRFSEDEYKHVTMELEDTALTNDDEEEEVEPQFIYVRIISEETDSTCHSDLRRIYRVNTGNVNGIYERVPIYRLYRFVRRQEDAGNAVAVYDNEPVNAIPFDETCRRIRDMLQEAWALPEYDRGRIIKRLRMKWHPDRNPDNQKYCSRIFNYISSVILLLESGQQVSSVVDERTGREVPDMSGSAYHRLVQRVDRRAETYMRAFRDNIDDYNRSTGSGPFSHPTAQVTRMPNIKEARRWMKQAKNDYRAARSYMSAARDVDGFNWICYTCHQACEKALRAAHFTKDANKVPGRSHSLGSICHGLGQDLINQVREFESRVCDYNAMRYPNAVAWPDIPSDRYSEEHAEFALEKTHGIIEKVEDTFDM